MPRFAPPRRVLAADARLGDRARRAARRRQRGRRGDRHQPGARRRLSAHVRRRRRPARDGVGTTASWSGSTRAGACRRRRRCRPTACRSAASARPPCRARRRAGCALAERFGTRPLGDARRAGDPASRATASNARPGLARITAWSAGLLARIAEAARIFLARRAARAARARATRSPALDDFYAARSPRAAPPPFTPADFAAHRAEWVDAAARAVRRRRGVRDAAQQPRPSGARRASAASSRSTGLAPGRPRAASRG